MPENKQSIWYVSCTCCGARWVEETKDGLLTLGCLDCGSSVSAQKVVGEAARILTLHGQWKGQAEPGKL